MPKNPKLPASKERDIQKACIFYFKTQGWLCHRMSQQPSINKKGQKYFPKTETPGVADYLCCVSGRFVAVEFKQRGKKQTMTQILYEQQVKKARGFYVIIHSIDEAQALVRRMRMEKAY